MSGAKKPRADRRLERSLAKAAKQARRREAVQASAPRSEFAPEEAPRVAKDPTESIMKMKVRFECHISADRAGRWSWGTERNWCSTFGATCSGGKSNCAIIELAKAVDGLTWAEIGTHLSGGHRKHHPQAVSSLVKEAQDRWAEIDRVEEEAFRFRASGAARLWGYRNGQTFYAVWWDPDHKIYPVEKNNT